MAMRPAAAATLSAGAARRKRAALAGVTTARYDSTVVRSAAVFLLTLAAFACASSQPTTPAPVAPAEPVVAAPAPAPVPPAPARRFYTLRGSLNIGADCSGTQTSIVEMGVTLRNAEHEVKLDRDRISTFGSNYRLHVEWPVAWGTPTEWTGLEVTLIGGRPICGGTCAAGSCAAESSLPSSLPVAQPDSTTFNIDYRCGCR